MLLLSTSVWAQDTLRPSATSVKNKQDSFWRRVNVGGNIGFTFGSVTGIVISPEANVRVVNYLYLGLGFTYQYFFQKDYFYNQITKDYYDYSSSVYGGRIYARYYLRSIFKNFLGNLYPHVEYEYLFYTRPYRYDPYGDIIDPYFNHFSPGKTNIEVNSLFVGAGFSQPLAGRAYIDFMILFNLNDSYNSPYTNPIFRVGFGIGL
jgi:hypothetical protein